MIDTFEEEFWIIPKDSHPKSYSDQRRNEERTALLKSLTKCADSLISSDGGRGIQFGSSNVEAQDFVQAINRILLHGLKLDVELKSKFIDLFLVIKLIDRPLPVPIASLSTKLDHFERERAWIRYKLNEGSLTTVLSVFTKDSPSTLYYSWGLLMHKPAVESFIEQLKKVEHFIFTFDPLEDPVGFVTQSSLKFYVRSFPSSYNADTANTKIISENSQRNSLKPHTYISPLSAIGTGTSVIKVEKSRKKRRPKTAVIIEDPDAVMDGDDDDGYAHRGGAKTRQKQKRQGGSKMETTKEKKWAAKSPQEVHSEEDASERNPTPEPFPKAKTFVVETHPQVSPAEVEKKEEAKKEVEKEKEEPKVAIVVSKPVIEEKEEIKKPIVEEKKITPSKPIVEDKKEEIKKPVPEKKEEIKTEPEKKEEIKKPIMEEKKEEIKKPVHEKKEVSSNPFEDTPKKEEISSNPFEDTPIKEKVSSNPFEDTPKKEEKKAFFWKPVTEKKEEVKETTLEKKETSSNPFEDTPKKEEKKTFFWKPVTEKKEEVKETTPEKKEISSNPFEEASSNPFEDTPKKTVKKETSLNPFEDTPIKEKVSSNPFEDTPKKKEISSNPFEDTPIKEKVSSNPFEDTPKKEEISSNPFEDENESNKPEEVQFNPFEEEESNKLEEEFQSNPFEDENETKKSEEEFQSNPFEDEEPKKPEDDFQSNPFEDENEFKKSEEEEEVPTNNVTKTEEIQSNPFEDDEPKEEEKEPEAAKEEPTPIKEEEPIRPVAVPAVKPTKKEDEEKRGGDSSRSSSMSPVPSQSPQELVKQTEDYIRRRFEELKEKSKSITLTPTDKETLQAEIRSRSATPEARADSPQKPAKKLCSNNGDDDDDDVEIASVFTMYVKGSTVIDDYDSEDKKNTLYDIAKGRRDRMYRELAEQRWSMAPPNWVPEYDKLNFYLFNRPEYRIKRGNICYKCGKNSTGILFAGLKFCEYTGKYMCSSCMNGRKFVIPGRIVHEWDFNEYPINNTSFEYLSKIYNDPIISITKCNPYLYKKIIDLEEVRMLRKKLFYVRDIIMACPRDDDGSSNHCKQLFRSLKKYLYEELDTYSLWDLVNHEKVLEDLDITYSESVKHIMKCKECSSKGSICKICKNKTPIFLYEFQTAAACKCCSNVYHIACLSHSTCPVCTGGESEYS